MSRDNTLLSTMDEKRKLFRFRRGHQTAQLIFPEHMYREVLPLQYKEILCQHATCQTALVVDYRA